HCKGHEAQLAENAHGLERQADVFRVGVAKQFGKLRFKVIRQNTNETRSGLSRGNTGVSCFLHHHMKHDLRGVDVLAFSWTSQESDRCRADRKVRELPQLRQLRYGVDVIMDRQVTER